MSLVGRSMSRETKPCPPGTLAPISINLARDRLKIKGIKLPSNNDLYDILRNARLVDADEAGRSVRRIKVQGRQGNTVLLSALIFPADKVVPKQIGRASCRERVKST